MLSIYLEPLEELSAICMQKVAFLLAFKAKIYQWNEGLSGRRIKFFRREVQHLDVTALARLTQLFQEQTVKS